MKSYMNLLTCPNISLRSMVLYIISFNGPLCGAQVQLVLINAAQAYVSLLMKVHSSLFSPSVRCNCTPNLHSYWNFTSKLQRQRKSNNRNTQNLGLPRCRSTKSYWCNSILSWKRWADFGPETAGTHLSRNNPYQSRWTRDLIFKRN